MLYKSLFYMAILGLSGVDARLFNQPAVEEAAVEAAVAVEKEVPNKISELEGMIEAALLENDPEFQFDAPDCECPCSFSAIGKGDVVTGVIITPVGTGLVSFCVPEAYTFIFLYFPVRLVSCWWNFCEQLKSSTPHPLHHGLCYIFFCHFLYSVLSCAGSS